MALAPANPLLRQYQKTQAETANPVQLVVMLYDGAIRFLTIAREKMLSGELEARHIHLIKAQRIISELLATLDREKGGDVAANLSALYGYMMKQLLEANLQDQVEPIDEVVNMLRELRASWAELAEQVQKESVTPRAA